MVPSPFWPARHGFLACVALFGAFVWPLAVAAQGLRPGTLLIYYSYPTSINAVFSVPAAAQEFGRYDFVVWGDGLDDPAHPDHANALAILAHPALVATQVFGYVDLGVSTQNLPIAEIEARLLRWRQMGVTGVLLDDFGYDYGTSRARQNAAVDYAHAQGLRVIANVFIPDDAFGSQPHPIHNPAGVATRLEATDFYLYESHGVILGGYEDGAFWQLKSDALAAYQQALGFQVLSVTTPSGDGPGAYDAGRFFYAWYAALMNGHAATGWGEYLFSASGASNGQAPFRVRPNVDPGTVFTGPVLPAPPLHSRRTDLGRIDLDTSLHTFGFLPQAVAVDPTRAEARVALLPNPVLAEGRVVFALAHAGDIRLTLYDVRGRRVALLASGEHAPGRHEVRWTGFDDAGRRLAPGTYFLQLVTAGRRSVERVLHLR